MTEINIIEKLDEATARRIKQYPHPNNRASEAGHPCIRFLVLSRLEPKKKLLHDIGLQRIFDEGNLHEDAVLREMADAGIKTTEQQRPYEWKKFELAGRLDAKIPIDGDYIPLEIKSCSPNIFPVLKPMKPEEMVNSKYLWIRKYLAQILLYMVMDGKEMGIIIFKNKSTGEKLQKIVHLTDENLSYIETILQKLEKVNDYVRRNEVPLADPCEDCKGCGFAKTACFPGQDFGPGFDFISNEEIEAKLLRWHETINPHHEHEDLDKELKEHFKGKSAVVGDFLIESKEYERTNYAIPDEIKNQYAEKVPYWRTKIERL